MSKRDLGMNRPISRRDFVGGVAVAISGGLAWRWSEAQSLSVPNSGFSIDPDSYPPVRTGMRGSHPGSFEVAHQMRDGARWDDVHETGEVYDLVVVGGGLSGLAAAWYFREARPGARILILDNHDDFGGHARRNEFWHGGRMVLGHGGTEEIQDISRYTDSGRRLLGALGIDVRLYPRYHQEGLYPTQQMHRALFFGAEHFGKDRLVVGEEHLPWSDFFMQVPVSESAQQELIRLYESETDYLEGLSTEEKVDFLQKTSYQAYLMNKAGLSAEAVSVMWQSTTWAIGFDQVSAWVAVGSEWPGTAGLGLGDYWSEGAVESGESVYFRFPDGNATVARLLVRLLIPAVASGNTMDDVVGARFDYSALDQAGSPVRIRLNSTAIRVEHDGDPQTAENVTITYVQNGKAHRVRGRQCVLACYNTAIPYLCNELPAGQKKALSQALKAPLIYSNVLLRNWTAFKKLGMHRARCPGSYFEAVRLSDPVNIGGYHHAQNPEEPIVVRMYRAPLNPELRGQPPAVQWRAGRNQLLKTSFETFENQIRDQLGRMLSAGGFDPAPDILAITVNRWPHGYAYGHDPETGQMAWMLDELPPESSPWLKARKPFGRIAIANSDAVADAMTEGAFEAAELAVNDLISS